MARTAQDRLTAAAAAFESGFLSMAAKKRALDDLNRAYDEIRRGAHDRQITAANNNPGMNNDGENRMAFFAKHDLPFDLHQVRDRHIEIIGLWSDDANLVRELIALRAAIKEAAIAPAPAKPEIEVRAETVRRTIVEEMARRKSLFVEGLDLGRLWNEMFPGKDGEISLPVSVNAHWVHGHKGAHFVRHFFYLRGKLTPLNTILAIAEQLEREKA